MDSLKNSLDAISDAEWAKVAELAKTTPEELRQRYQAFLEEHPRHLRKQEVKLGAPEQIDNNCIRQNFDLTLFGLLGIRGHIVFCGTPQDWTLKLHVALVLAGIEVWSGDYTLSSNNTSICVEVSLILVRAKLCFGVRDRRACFYVAGEACYWDGGWNCASFDETILCLIP